MKVQLLEKEKISGGLLHFDETWEKYVDKDGATEIKFKESKVEAKNEEAGGVETECLTWEENESPIVGNANTSGGLLLSVETWEKYVDEDGATEIKFKGLKEEASDEEVADGVETECLAWKGIKETDASVNSKIMIIKKHL